MKNPPSPESVFFRNATCVCGGIVAVLGGLGLLGWISGWRILASITLNYIPMAPDTAVLFSAFGSILLFNAARPLSIRYRTFLSWVIALASIYGLLKSIEYVVKLDLTFENILFPITEKLGSFPLGRMSPIAGALFLLSGTALLFILWNESHSLNRNLAGGIGILICIAGYVATIGYLFGSPLLYGGDIIPLAATTAIAFMMLGIGLIVAAGHAGIFVRPFVGLSVRARMLRTFLPLVVATVLLADLVNDRLDDFAAVNHSLLSAMLSLVFALAASAAVVYVARSVSRAVDRAESERQHAVDELARERNLLRTVIDNLPVQIFAKDTESRYILNNENDAHFRDSAIEMLLGKTDFDIFPAEMAAYYRSQDQAVIQSGQAIVDHEETSGDASGKEHRLRVTKVPLRDSRGQPVGIVGIKEDITERKRAEEALRESETRYRSLFENMLDGFAYCKILFDDQDRPVDFVYLDVNSAFEKLTGLDHVVGKRVTEVIPGIQQSNPELFETYGRVALTGQSEKFEVDFKPLGQWLSVSVYSSAKGYFVAVFDDITERKRAEQALLQAEEKYHMIFDYAVEGIFQSTPEGRFIAANTALARMWGYATPQELISTITNIAEQVYADPSQRSKFRWLMEEQGEVQGFEFQARRKDGSLMWVSENARAVRDIDGVLLYYEGTTQNITDRKQTENELLYLSTHDALTGLYNRAFFETELTRLDQGRHSPVSVVMADLNGLKQINDKQGHAAGDELLRQAAQVFRAAFRAEDVVARIGGDEFAVLLPKADATDAAEALTRIRKCLAAANSHRQDLPLSFALGAASSNRHDSLIQAMEEADRQMYVDKSAQVKNSIAQ